MLTLSATKYKLLGYDKSKRMWRLSDNKASSDGNVVIISAKSLRFHDPYKHELYLLDDKGRRVLISSRD